MTGKIKNLFQIPQGTESLSLKEASTHRRITDALEALFLSWGYFPVQTPVFDFFDIYRPLLKSASLEKVYRLIDREGDLLMLRSDVTLFLAAKDYTGVVGLSADLRKIGPHTRSRFHRFY